MNKHFITDEILRLILAATEGDRGTRAAFCRHAGISPSSLSKILNGNKKFVYGDEWNRLCATVPEIAERNNVINANHSTINGGLVIGNNAQINNSMGHNERFKAKLIEAVIRLQIDPAAKDAVLKLIADFTG